MINYELANVILRSTGAGVRPYHGDGAVNGDGECYLT